MADTKAADDMSSISSSGRVWGPFWTTSLRGAFFAVDVSLDFSAYFTTDGGSNWTKNNSEAGTHGRSAVWFDRQEVGNSGTLAHCVFLNDPGAGSSETFRYANYDISNDTWSAPVTITGSLTLSGAYSCFITGTKAGGLIAGFANPAATQSGAAKSTDGASWSAITSPWESNAGDWAQGVWCDTDDDNDGAILFWDISADAISIKVYDDSGDSWTETAVASSMVEHASLSSWSAATRLSDGKVIAYAWNAVDSATADLKGWELNINSVASPVVTGLTDVVTDLAESGGCAVYIDPNSNVIYCAYLKGGTWAATVDAKYKSSADGGTTWSVEHVYSDGAAANSQAISAGAASALGGQFLPVFCEQTNLDMWVNLVNGAGLAAVTVAGSLMLMGVG